MGLEVLLNVGEEDEFPVVSLIVGRAELVVEVVNVDFVLCVVELHHGVIHGGVFVVAMATALGLELLLMMDGIEIG